jgi:ferritin
MFENGFKAWFNPLLPDKSILFSNKDDHRYNLPRETASTRDAKLKGWVQIYQSPYSISIESKEKNNTLFKKIQEYILQHLNHDPTHISVVDWSYYSKNGLFETDAYSTSSFLSANNLKDAAEKLWLNESKSVGTLYHYTSFENLLSILEKDSLYPGPSGGVSFTRDKNLHRKAVYFGPHNPVDVRISFNGSLLSDKYRIKPYAYHSIDVNVGDEAEEVIYNTIQPVSKYLIGIEIIRSFDELTSKRLVVMSRWFEGRDPSYLDYMTKLNQLAPPNILIKKKEETIMNEDIERFEDIYDASNDDIELVSGDGSEESEKEKEFSEDEPLLSYLSEWYNKELYSAYLYPYFSAKANAVGLLGVEQLFYRKWEEETEHAEEVLQFTLKRCKDAQFFPIEGDFDTLLGSGDDPAGIVLNMFNAALRHEKEVTAFITELKEQTDASCEFIINKYLDEQVEEEDEVTTWVDRATLAAQEGNILLFDQEVFSGTTGDSE